MIDKITDEMQASQVAERIGGIIQHIFKLHAELLCLIWMITKWRMTWKRK